MDKLKIRFNFVYIDFDLSVFFKWLGQTGCKEGFGCCQITEFLYFIRKLNHIYAAYSCAGSDDIKTKD